MVRAEMEDQDIPQNLEIGARAEEAKLGTAERLTNLIAILCIVSWRVFWITMLNRTDAEASPNDAFTKLDQYLLDESLPQKAAASPAVSRALLRQTRSPWRLPCSRPRSATRQYRDLERPFLTDIELGIMIGVQLVDN